MRILTSALLLFTLIFNSGCVRVPGDGTDSGDPELNPWTQIENLATTQAILNTFPVADALFLVTGDEFIRINADNVILEKRALTGTFTNIYKPAISANTFARVSESSSGDVFIEFHLTKNPNDFRKIAINDLSDIPGEVLELVVDGKELGAFNFDGSKFLIATTTKTAGSTGSHHALFEFSILLDASTRNIINITHKRLCDITEIPGSFDQIGSIVFNNEDRYIISKVGAYKVNKDGDVTRIKRGWYQDLFRRNGKIYITAFERFDMLISDDNGDTWERTPTASDLQFVTVAGETLISQTANGILPQTPENLADIFTLKDLRMNREMLGTDFVGSFNAFDFFAEKYYFAIGKDLYSTDKILVEE